MHRTAEALGRESVHDRGSEAPNVDWVLAEGLANQATHEARRRGRDTGPCYFGRNDDRSNPSGSPCGKRAYARAFSQVAGVKVVRGA